MAIWHAVFHRDMWYDKAVIAGWKSGRCLEGDFLNLEELFEGFFKKPGSGEICSNLKLLAGCDLLIQPVNNSGVLL